MTPQKLYENIQDTEGEGALVMVLWSIWRWEVLG